MSANGQKPWLGVIAKLTAATAIVAGLASCTCADPARYAGTYRATSNITLASGRTIPSNHLFIDSNGTVTASRLPRPEVGSYAQVGTLCGQLGNPPQGEIRPAPSSKHSTGIVMTASDDYRILTLSRAAYPANAHPGNSVTYIRISAGR